MLKGMLGTLMQALAEREPPAPLAPTTPRAQPTAHTTVTQVEPATAHGLTSYPPVEKWNDWAEYDPKAWPRKVPRRYTLVPTVCFNCESACGLLGYVDKDTLTIQKFEGNPLHPGSRGRNCAKGPATLKIGPMLAAYLDLPYIGVVNNVTIANRVATVRKEYSGGVMAEFEVRLPMVVGVQAASQPPRYAPVSKVRQIAKTAAVDEIEADAGDAGAGIAVRCMAKPVAAGHAEMIGGDAKTVAGRIVEILRERGLL
jgi:Molybdopterin oxidoreductase Fe4S4 domain/Electron transfer flavoprotein domain